MKTANLKLAAKYEIHKKAIRNGIERKLKKNDKHSKENDFKYKGYT